MLQCMKLRSVKSQEDGSYLTYKYRYPRIRTSCSMLCTQDFIQFISEENFAEDGWAPEPKTGVHPRPMNVYAEISPTEFLASMKLTSTLVCVQL